MTAPSTRPEAMALTAKRKDTTPKKLRRTRVEHDTTRGVSEARKLPNTGTLDAVRAISPDKPLTEKQKLFVQFWAQGESILSASAKAGYNDSGTYAYRLVQQPNVLALKSKYEAEYRQSVMMDRQQVMEGLKESIDMAKLMSEPATMIAGWREIGKLCGFYAPVEQKIKIDVSGDVTMRTLNQLSDAELLELIQKGNPDVPALEE